MVRCAACLPLGLLDDAPPGGGYPPRVGDGHQAPRQGNALLLGEGSESLPDLKTATGPGHLAERDDDSSGSSESILVQGIRRRLCPAVRWHGENYAERPCRKRLDDLRSRWMPSYPTRL